MVRRVVRAVRIAYLALGLHIRPRELALRPQGQRLPGRARGRKSPGPGALSGTQSHGAHPWKHMPLRTQIAELPITHSRGRTACPAGEPASTYSRPQGPAASPPKAYEKARQRPNSQIDLRFSDQIASNLGAQSDLI